MLQIVIFGINLVDQIKGTFVANQVFIIPILVVFILVLVYIVNRFRIKRQAKKKLQQRAEKEEEEENFVSEFDMNAESADTSGLKSPTKRRFSRLKDISYSRENLLDDSSEKGLH